MNSAQIHLALNHVPLLLSITGGGILLLGMIIKNESYKSLSLYLLVLAALFTAPVFLTGEGTEEMIEHLPGVDEAAIEKHQDMAKISLIIIIMTGIVSLPGILIRRSTGFAKAILAAALLFSMASFGTMAWTAHLGGLIRHSEIQNTASAGDKSSENEEGEEQEKNPSLSTGQTTTSATDSTQLKQKKNEQVKENDDD